MEQLAFEVLVSAGTDLAIKLEPTWVPEEDAEDPAGFHVPPWGLPHSLPLKHKIKRPVKQTCINEPPRDGHPNVLGLRGYPLGRGEMRCSPEPDKPS